MFRLWARVLAAVPNSRLLLKYVNWFANPSAQARILEEGLPDVLAQRLALGR